MRGRFRAAFFVAQTRHDLITSRFFMRLASISQHRVRPASLLRRAGRRRALQGRASGGGASAGQREFAEAAQIELACAEIR
jgi:hypothetical protein